MKIMSQAKKGNGADSIECLEELLTKGDHKTYGLACWLLANRDPQRYQARDVITESVWVDTSSSDSKKYRLTEDSIENIGRCLGMRTPEEASLVFRKPKAKEAKGKCPNGHPEAALQYIMYGIKPTDPCPVCGEIPSFEGSFKSLNFGSSKPIKGTDGEVYQACPKCGDDMIQLEGSDPKGWGWEIACMSCDWRIKQAEELDIHQYSYLMEEIKLKLDAIYRLMEIPGIINKTRVESACLQLRMVLELIIFSSLVSNKDAWKKSQEELRKVWNVKKIMKDLEGIHEKYYPEPKSNTDDFLTKERLVTVYSKLNKIIHAENPLGNGIDLKYYMDEVPKWLSWIINLLMEHKVFLYHHPDVFYWVRMFGDVEGEVLCISIRIDANGKETCSWPDCVEDGNRTFCEYIGDSWRNCNLVPLEPGQTAAKRIMDVLDA